MPLCAPAKPVGSIPAGSMLALCIPDGVGPVLPGKDCKGIVAAGAVGLTGGAAIGVAPGAGVAPCGI